MSTRTTESVRSDALVFDAVPSRCSCDRGTRVSAEGVTQGGAEARLASGVMSEAIANKEFGVVGTSIAASVVAGRSSADGSILLAIQLYRTNSGVRCEYTLLKRSRGSLACFAWIVVLSEIVFHANRPDEIFEPQEKRKRSPFGVEWSLHEATQTAIMALSEESYAVIGCMKVAQECKYRPFGTKDVPEKIPFPGQRWAAKQVGDPHPSGVRLYLRHRHSNVLRSFLVYSIGR